jgi:hypothetical protein
MGLIRNNCGVMHSYSMTIKNLMTMKNYCSLKFLALEVGRFFWHFQPELMYSAATLSRCAQAFYFNISILLVETNNFLEKVAYV